MFTGIDFTKRLPCGEVERARRAIRTFFKLRQLSLGIQGCHETKLPLSSPDSCVQVQDVLDLNNSDLLAVTVTSKQPPSTSAHRCVFMFFVKPEKNYNQLHYYYENRRI